jgi:hypothetical protein
MSKLIKIMFLAKKFNIWKVTNTFLQPCFNPDLASNPYLLSLLLLIYIWTENQKKGKGSRG